MTRGGKLELSMNNQYECLCAPESMFWIHERVGPNSLHNCASLQISMEPNMEVAQDGVSCSMLTCRGVPLGFRKVSEPPRTRRESQVSPPKFLPKGPQTKNNSQKNPPGAGGNFQGLSIGVLFGK